VFHANKSNKSESGHAKSLHTQSFQRLLASSSHCYNTVKLFVGKISKKL